MLNKESKIYVAGHRGLVGSAIWNNLLQRGYTNLVGRTHRELDLTDQRAVRAFFDEQQPEGVVLAAAFVGGIMANSLYRADFIISTIGMIFTNISGFVSFWIVFRNFPSIAGWNYYEILFLYGFSLISLTTTFFASRFLLIVLNRTCFPAMYKRSPCA